MLDQPKQTLGSIFEKTKMIPSNLQAYQTKLQLFKRIKQNLAENNKFIYKVLHSMKKINKHANISHNQSNKSTEMIKSITRNKQRNNRGDGISRQEC